MKKLLSALSLTVLFCLSAFAEAKNDNVEFISTAEAKELIGKPGVVFVSGDNPDSYNVGHIPGSVNMEAHHLHHTDIVGHMHCTPLLMCPDEAAKFIGSKGIDNNTLVIAYDNFAGPNASGVWLFMKLYGHDKVKILKDGWMGLKNIGVVMEKGNEPKKEAKNYVIDPAKINHDLIASKEDVLTAVEDITKNGKNSKYVIIDGRRFEEVIGKTKLDNVARGGHIPYSTFLEWSFFGDAKDKKSYKSLDSMREILEKQGVTKDKTIYTYCHVGTGRGSYLQTVLKQLGYDNVKTYTGSWDEWGNDYKLPIRR